MAAKKKLPPSELDAPTVPSIPFDVITESEDLPTFVEAAHELETMHAVPDFAHEDDLPTDIQHELPFSSPSASEHTAVTKEYVQPLPSDARPPPKSSRPPPKSSRPPPKSSRPPPKSARPAQSSGAAATAPSTVRSFPAPPPQIPRPSGAPMAVAEPPVTHIAKAPPLPPSKVATAPMPTTADKRKEKVRTQPLKAKPASAPPPPAPPPPAPAAAMPDPSAVPSLAEALAPFQPAGPGTAPAASASAPPPPQPQISAAPEPYVSPQALHPLPYQPPASGPPPPAWPPEGDAPTNKLPALEDATNKLPALPASPAPRRGLLGLAIAAVSALVVAATLIGLATLWWVRRTDTTDAPRGAVSPSTTQASTAAARATGAAPQSPGSSKPAAPAAASAAAVPQVAALSCTRAKAPIKIADDVVIGGSLTSSSFGDKIAVGYPAARFAARGIEINAKDLSTRTLFSEEFTRPVFRVTPLPGPEPKDFAVDHDDPRLKSVRTVPGRPAFQIGVNYFGVVRLQDEGPPELIWEGGRNQDISEPSFAKGVKGHVVAFRRGRFSDRLQVGWLTESGDKQSELAELAVAGTQLGPPALAASDTEILVAVSAKAPDGAQRLHLARAPVGSAPSELSLLSAAGEQATWPSVVALPNKHWLVQWIASDQVKAQVVDDSVKPVGEPVSISTSGQAVAAQPAAVARVGSALVTLYPVVNGRKIELWAAGLSCL